MFENFAEEAIEKLFDGFDQFRTQQYNGQYVRPEDLMDDVSIELHNVCVDMQNAANGHVGKRYDNDYLRPMVYDDPAWIAYCLRQELDDPNLDAFMLRELERVFSLGIPLALLMNHDWAIPTEEGLESLKCDLEDIQEIKEIRRAWPRVDVNQIMKAQWNRKHLRYCKGCEFDAHKPNAEKVNV